MEDIVKILFSDGVFSVGVAAFLLIRMESRLETLTTTILELQNCIERLKDELS